MMHSKQIYREESDVILKLSWYLGRSTVQLQTSLIFRKLILAFANL